ncbi:MAG: D-alanyl-D-alanine carboxypeptidase, partial [Armatimonadetes bacterium]|nr:D-alanyl-D-alanine carboxypeptidase [Armatimonadota bacterium]
HHPEHKSTAYDLALIARAAMMNPEFAKIVGTSTWTWEHPTDTRVLVNRNRLLWQFSGADGVKTGWTSQSGRSLVASATRDGWRLISVVLNAPMMFTESMRLLNHGFDSFASLKVAPRGAVLARAHVGEQELRAIVLADVYAVVPKGRTVTSRVTLRRDLTLPIARGSNVGEAVFLNAGAEVARAPLVAAGDIYPPSMAARIRRWLRSWQLWWR